MKEDYSKKEKIDLANKGLTEFPSDLRGMPNLKSLNLSNNKIQEIPAWISELGKLEVLDLRNNYIKSLGKEIGKLENLKCLYLRDNELIDIPFELSLLPQLVTVFVGGNKIEKFPSWFFEIENIIIDGNPIMEPPVEVHHRGIEAIKNYYKERQQGVEQLHEAKLLIVGEPGAGKTTLMNKIMNEDFVLNPFSPSTKGIEIEKYIFKSSDDSEFRINIWDFGGQEIYHATHQFFLTKRSLYILLSDNRAEDTDFHYWLQTIELLSDNSPIIIVQNEKQDRKKDINEYGMRERFKTIKRIFAFNIANNPQKLRSLTSEIKSDIIGLSHIGTELPKIWVQIRTALEEKSKSVPFISELEYLEICEKYGMAEKERAYFLSDYLHDLGVFLHFRDNPVLKRWIILRPDWGTEAVYKVLDDTTVIENKGYFTKQDLKSIWNESVYLDMHDELISLMMRFELCYQLEGEKDVLIAAQLLDRLKPVYEWDTESNLSVTYAYAFMPKGIITRFIVKMHYYITNQKLVWREGVVLERQSTKAEVIETYGEREIKIRISGKNKKEFLAVILDSFDKIHATYTNIRVNKRIPCNCDQCVESKTPYQFVYDDVRRFLEAGIMEDRCRISLKNIRLRSMVDDAFGNNHESNSRALLTYLSFSTLDTTFKRALEKHLNPLVKSGKISLFDREKVTAGHDEKKELRESLDVAEVVILLISANYINDDWTHNYEMSRALDRSSNGTCVTIPVIIKDCHYQVLSLAKYKPILFRDKPLFTAENVDEALTHAAFNIQKSIDGFIEKNDMLQRRTILKEINEKIRKKEDELESN